MGIFSPSFNPGVVVSELYPSWLLAKKQAFDQQTRYTTPVGWSKSTTNLSVKPLTCLPMFQNVVQISASGIPTTRWWVSCSSQPGHDDRNDEAGSDVTNELHQETGEQTNKKIILVAWLCSRAISFRLYQSVQTTVGIRRDLSLVVLNLDQIPICGTTPSATEWALQWFNNY